MRCILNFPNLRKRSDPMFVVYEMRRGCKDIPESQIECITFDEKYLGQYKELYNAAFRPMREALDIKPYDWYGNDRAILSKAHEINLLTDGDELIGSVSLIGNEIDDLFVSDPRRREGYGRKILIWAMNQLASQGAGEFVLHVAEWNAGAVKLYLDEGFEITKKDQIGIEMVSFDSSYKQRVFAFTDKCFAELGKKFEPDGRHGFYNDIENEFVVFYCVVDHGNVVGTVALKKIDDDTVELKALYLDKEYRGKGLGARLMTEAVGAARTLGYKSIVLDSMKQYKSAHKLYEAFGFKDTERYNDNAMADVFMKLDL